MVRARDKSAIFIPVIIYFFFVAKHVFRIYIKVKLAHFFPYHVSNFLNNHYYRYYANTRLFKKFNLPSFSLSWHLILIFLFFITSLPNFNKKGNLKLSGPQITMSSHYYKKSFY